eukprot:PhF_6_TR36032/c0_g1_i1/m.52235
MEFNDRGTIGVLWDDSFSDNSIHIPSAFFARNDHILIAGDYSIPLSSLVPYENLILRFLDVLNKPSSTTTPLSSSRGLYITCQLHVDSILSTIEKVLLKELCYFDSLENFAVLSGEGDALDELGRILVDLDVPENLIHSLMCRASAIHKTTSPASTFKFQASEIASMLGVQVGKLQEWMAKGGWDYVKNIAASMWSESLHTVFGFLNTVKKHRATNPTPSSSKAVVVTIRVVPTFTHLKVENEESDVSARIRNVVLRHRPWYASQLLDLFRLPQDVQEQYLRTLVFIFGPESTAPIPLQQYVESNEFLDLPFEKQLHTFYSIFDPSKIQHIGNELKTHRFREDVFFQELEKLYGCSYIFSARYCRSVFYGNRDRLETKWSESEFMERLDEYRNHEFRLVAVLKKANYATTLSTAILSQYMTPKEFIKVFAPAAAHADNLTDKEWACIAREVLEAAVTQCGPSYSDTFVLARNLLSDLAVGSCFGPTCTDLLPGCKRAVSVIHGLRQIQDLYDATGLGGGVVEHVMGPVRYSRYRMEHTVVPFDIVQPTVKAGKDILQDTARPSTCTILLLRREHKMHKLIKSLTVLSPPRRTHEVRIPLGEDIPYVPPTICAIPTHIEEMEVSCRQVFYRQEEFLWCCMILRMCEILQRGRILSDRCLEFFNIGATDLSNRVVAVRRDVETWEVLERRKHWHRYVFQRNVLIASRSLLRSETEARSLIELAEAHKRGGIPMYISKTIRSPSPIRPQSQITNSPRVALTMESGGTRRIEFVPHLVETPQKRRQDQHHHLATVITPKKSPHTTPSRTRGSSSTASRRRDPSGPVLVLRRDCYVYENMILMDGSFVRIGTAVALDPLVKTFGLASWSDGSGGPIPSIQLYKVPLPNDVPGHRWTWQGEWLPCSAGVDNVEYGHVVEEDFSVQWRSVKEDRTLFKRKRWMRICVLEREKLAAN